MTTSVKAAQQNEFYLCLARAFMAPLKRTDFDAMRDFLAEDLEELSCVLEYPIAAELVAFREAIGAVTDHETLLVIYSRLFLDPGSRIPINTGMYFDGAVMGGTVAKMEACYRACGLEKSDGFCDLADHVAVQLEFVSYLYGAEAARLDEMATPLPMRGGHFLRAFVAPWAPRLVAEIEGAARIGGFAVNPYLALARIVEKAAEADAETAADSAFGKDRQQTALDKARAKRALHGVSADDMKSIELTLREHGLATEHLQIPVDQRDAAMGMTRKEPPVPRRKM